MLHGDTNAEISHKTGHCRQLIGDIRNDYSKGETIFRPIMNLGRPTKITEQLKDTVSMISFGSPRLSLKEIANRVKLYLPQTDVSSETIRRILIDLKIRFLPPIESFPLTEIQKENRLEFAKQHLSGATDWNKAMFVDESSFYLDQNSRWLWRKRGDHRPEVTCFKSKFPKHLMMFGGISRLVKTPLILVEGNIDAIEYIDQCIDNSGLIPEMNEAYGINKWFLVQDGAICHKAGVTMDYLTTYCHVLEKWPSGSPDLNPIENLWAIVKNDVEEAHPETLEDLKNAAFQSWESIEQITIDNLINSMTIRLNICVDRKGDRTDY
jgi:hypothetical protein